MKKTKVAGLEKAAALARTLYGKSDGIAAGVLAGEVVMLRALGFSRRQITSIFRGRRKAQ